MKDVDLDNDLISLQVTKNRKSGYILILSPLNKVLTEYMIVNEKS